MPDAGTDLWNVLEIDQILPVCTNHDAATTHGERIIRAYYQDAMDRRRVPESHRAIDCRLDAPAAGAPGKRPF